MSREKGKKLAADLNRFKELWLSNPAAQLEFAKLVDRVSTSVDLFDTVQWIAEERRRAELIGVR